MANLLERLGVAVTDTLSVKRGRWRTRGGAEPNDADFQKIKPKILARDDHTCSSCGIYSESGMEAHHANDIHEDNSNENLKTTCPLCHATHHIGFIGKNGAIIHLDELSQADLFNLLRTAAIAAEKGDDEQKRTAEKIFAAIDSCKRAVATSWGTSSPLDFADAMMSMPNDVYANRQMVMSGLKLSINQKILNSESLQHIKTIQIENGAYHSTPPQTWDAIYAKNIEELERRTIASSEMMVAEKIRSERLHE